MSILRKVILSVVLVAFTLTLPLGHSGETVTKRNQIQELKRRLNSNSQPLKLKAWVTKLKSEFKDKGLTEAQILVIATIAELYFQAEVFSITKDDFGDIQKDMFQSNPSIIFSAMLPQDLSSNTARLKERHNMLRESSLKKVNAALSALTVVSDDLTYLVLPETTDAPEDVLDLRFNVTGIALATTIVEAIILRMNTQIESQFLYDPNISAPIITQQELAVLVQYSQVTDEDANKLKAISAQWKAHFDNTQNKMFHAQLLDTISYLEEVATELEDGVNEALEDELSFEIAEEARLEEERLLESMTDEERAMYLAEKELHEAAKAMAATPQLEGPFCSSTSTIPDN